MTIKRLVLFYCVLLLVGCSETDNQKSENVKTRPEAIALKDSLIEDTLIIKNSLTEPAKFVLVDTLFNENPLLIYNLSDSIYVEYNDSKLALHNHDYPMFQGYGKFPCKEVIEVKGTKVHKYTFYALNENTFVFTIYDFWGRVVPIGIYCDKDKIGSVIYTHSLSGNHNNLGPGFALFSFAKNQVLLLDDSGEGTSGVHILEIEKDRFVPVREDSLLADDYSQQTFSSDTELDAFRIFLHNKFLK